MMTAKEKADVLGVRLVCKSDSLLMRAIGFAIVWNPSFMSSFWTTITLPGYRYVFYPDTMTLEHALLQPILWHELEHVVQADGPWRWSRWAWNLGFAFFYLAMPVPIFFAYFRMRWEVDAYVVGYLKTENPVAPETYAKWVALNLWTNYALTWPKRWSEKRFLRRLGEARR